MSNVVFKNTKIIAIKNVVPEHSVNIDDEIQYFENSEKKLNRAKKMIGYGKRHVVDKNTTSLDLAYEAAKQLIEETKTDKDSIDAILFLSQTRDYSSPASANILHGLLDLNENCAAMDLSQGCSGYLYGLWTAHSLIQSGASKKVLLLVSDTISKYSCTQNRLVNQIFGDSASATLLEYTAKETPSYFSVKSRGKGWDNIIIPSGGSRIPIDREILDNNLTDESNNIWNLSHILMDGLKVFDFTMDVAPKSINEILEFSGFNKDDIELFILHQANKQIVESVATKADIPLSKTPTNTFSEFGNTACNSVGLCLSHRATFGGWHLICAFGVGLSWGSAIVDLSETKNLGISLYKDTKNTPTKDGLKKYFINKFLKKRGN